MAAFSYRALASVITALLLATVTPLASLRLLTRNGHVPSLLVCLWAWSFHLPIPKAFRDAVKRLISYPFIVGAIAVATPPNGNGYLVVRHRYPTGRSDEFWGLPGGAIDKYEDPAAALKRELAQELGLDASCISARNVLVIDSSEAPYLDLFFECQITNGHLGSSSEVAEAAYFPIERVPVGMSCRHLRVLEAIERNRSNGAMWPILLGSAFDKRSRKWHTNALDMRVENNEWKEEVEFEQRATCDALEHLAKWLSHHCNVTAGVERIVDGVTVFYSSHLLPVFRSDVALGISGAEERQGKYSIHLHAIWPTSFATDLTARAMREPYAAYLEEALDNEVSRYLPSNVSAKLYLHDPFPAGVAEKEGMHRISEDERSEYMGLMDSSVGRERGRRLRALIEDLQTVFDAATNSPIVDQQLHELLYGLRAKPAAVQRELVQKARELVHHPVM